MCIIFWGIGFNTMFPFILASNRDEFYARPTEPAHFWRPKGIPADAGTTILSGLDLQGADASESLTLAPDKDFSDSNQASLGLVENAEGGGKGTWIAVATDGKLSALTNFREPFCKRDKKLSRGFLVGNFVAGTASPREYVQTLVRNAGTGIENGTVSDVDVTRMAGFNLLCIDLRELLQHLREGSDTNADGRKSGEESVVYITNRCDHTPAAGEGSDLPEYPVNIQYPSELRRVYGLSNALLDSPWPKVEKGKRRFEEIVTAEVIDRVGEDAVMREEQRLLKELFALMNDTDPFTASNPPKAIGDLAKCICVPPWPRIVDGADGNSAAAVDYGTRSTCVILLATDGMCVFAERLFDAKGFGSEQGARKSRENWNIFRFNIVRSGK